MAAGSLRGYNQTIYACYLGYISQAIVNNFAPLLFIAFQSDLGLSLQNVTLITTVNFLVQLTVDLLAVKYVDRIGYRPCLIVAHVFCALGLAGMGLLPGLMDPYAGIMVSVVLYAIGGGLIEVLISPVVESCPTENKESVMSLLHSFYCWGHLGVVLLSTAFFRFAGIGLWPVLACCWAVLPAVNALWFAAVPLFPVTNEEERIPFADLLRQKVFWLVIVMMVCAGASEHGVAQWVSAFAESGLQLSKTTGDLLGGCSFALMMGSCRAIYGKWGEAIPLKKMMIGSSILCICCYSLAAFTASPLLGLVGCAICGFSVGIFWPGTFSMAAARLPGGGTAMFALMALAGDLGCSAGPTVVGMTADAAGGDLRKGLASAMLFPVVMLISASLMKYKSNRI